MPQRMQRSWWGVCRSVVWCAAFISFLSVAIAQTPPTRGPARRGPATRAAPVTTSNPEEARAVFERRAEQFKDARRKADADFARLLEDPQRPRWMILPEWITGVQFDRSGKAWFSGSDMQYVQSQRELSVEDAFAGTTQVIHDTSLLLIDSRKRFWTNESGLNSFDGKQWKHYRSRPRLGESIAPDTSPLRTQIPREMVLPSIHATGFEDRGGNCWFVAYHLEKWYVLRIKPDESLEMFEIASGTRAVNPSERHVFEFFEQDGGVVVLSARIGNRPVITDPMDDSPPATKIFRWDSRHWEEIAPGFCKHAIGFAMPKANGSIRYFCNGGRMWTWWPEDKLEAGVKLAKSLIPDLDALESDKREAAMRGMLMIGPQVVERLAKDPIPNLPPEAELRMQFLKGNAQKVREVDEDGAHTQLASVDVDVQVGAAKPIAHTHDGGVMLLAGPVAEPSKNRTSEQAYVRIDGDGKCTVIPRAEANFVNPHGASVAHAGFVDASKRTWIDTYDYSGHKPYYTTKLIGTDTQIDFAAPPGLEMTGILGQDSLGRIFARSERRIVVFDERQPESTFKPTHSGKGVVPMAASRVGVGWTIDSHFDGLLHVRRLDPTGVTELTRPADAHGQYHVVPLKGGAMLLKSGEKPRPFDDYFYDGKQWFQAPGFMRLIQENIKAILPLVGDGFYHYGGARLVADDRGGLWVVVARFDGDGQDNGSGEGAHWGSETIAYYDGKTWHDLRADLRPTVRQAPNILGFTNNGRTLVVSGDTGYTLLSITYDNEGKMQFERTGRVGSFTRRNTAYATDADGWFWFVGGVIPDSVYKLRGKELVSLPRDLRMTMLGADSKKRIWFYDTTRKAVRVAIKGELIDVPVKIDGPNVMFAESADGRLWVPHLLALSEVEVTGADDKPIVREVGRWVWDAPKNGIPRTFVDEANGLWIYGIGARVARYPLPGKAR